MRFELLALFFLSAFSQEVLLGGADVHGTRVFPSGINKNTIQDLKVDWTYDLCGTQTATPLVLTNKLTGRKEVVVSDHAGCIFKFDALNGTLLTQANFTQFGFPAELSARAMPVYHEASNTLIFGTGNVLSPIIPGVGAYLVSLNYQDFSLKYKTLVDSNPWVSFAQSPLLVNDTIYLGTTSGEYAALLYPGVDCCYFSGTIFSLDANTGNTNWKWEAIPLSKRGPGQYGGASIWASAPVLVENSDGTHDLAFGTGQLYQVPSGVRDCINANIENASCVDSDVYFDSFVVLNAESGTFKAGYRSLPNDVWNAACYFGLPSCQTPGVALDNDATNIVYSKLQDRYFAATKAGLVLSLSRNLTVLWKRLDVYGSVVGGTQYFSSLLDSENLDDLGYFVENRNGAGRNFVTPSGLNSTSGFWARYDGNGNLKWLTTGPIEVGQTRSVVLGGTAITNNVLLGYFEPPVDIYTGIGYPAHLAILDAQTGQVAKTFLFNEIVGGAMAVSEKQIFSGTGALAATIGGSAKKTFYALTVDKK